MQYLVKNIEGYFRLLKRRMKGIYKHCKSQSLTRYLYEFDFGYNKERVGRCQ